MNLLIVFAFAGDSTMTRFLAIAETPNGAGEARNSSRARHARVRVDRELLLVVLIFRAGGLVFLGLVVQRFVGDAEDFGGLSAVAVGHVERLLDHDALDLFHWLSERDHHPVL